MPSLQGLGRELRSQIRESEGDAPPVSLRAELRTARLYEQIRAAAQQGDDTAVKWLAELDADKAETQFEVLRRRLSGKTIKLAVAISTGSARGLTQLDNQVTSLTGRFTRLTAAVGVSTLRYG